VAAGAVALGGVALMATDAGSGGEGTTGLVGTTLFLLGEGAALVGDTAAECHKPSCQEENTSVTINAPSASPLKSSCLFTSGSDGKRRRMADNHDNVVIVHFSYIDRHGRLDIETDDGRHSWRPLNRSHVAPTEASRGGRRKSLITTLFFLCL